MLNTIHTKRAQRRGSTAHGFREIAGLSQRELAQRLAVQQAFVSKIESRERNLGLIEYIVACKATGACSEEIVGLVADIARSCELSI